MPIMQTVEPDGQKIRQLIGERGDTLAGFARSMRSVSARTIYGIIYTNRPTSIPMIREIARGLKVRPQDISDYKPPARRKAA